VSEIIRIANSEAWESYAGSPHFEDGDRRQDFDNGWDEAVQFLAPALVLLRDWEQSNAAGEAIDLADKTYELLQGLRLFHYARALS